MDGESIGGGGPPTIGASWTDGGPYRLADDGVSRAPRRANEVAMDAATARDNGFSVGDHVRVLLRGPAQKFEIVGIFGFGDRDDLGAITFAAFDLRTAQEVFEAPGALDRIYVQTDPGTATSVVKAQLEQSLGGRFEVLTVSEAIDQIGETVRTFLGFFTYALLGFAAIGVVVGAFVIFNTFTILVTQRTRELGLLRAMGASGAQVVWSVVLEALVVGAIASAFGLLLGIGLGIGLLELLRTIGLDLPETSTVLLARTVIVSLAVGVLVTVAAAVLPALRAARVPPVAAINDVRPRSHAGFRRRVIAGLAFTAVSAGILVYGLVRAENVTGLFDQVQVVALGAFGVLVGVVMLLATVARPLAATVGWPLRVLGMSGLLARANAMRNPRRTAVTASALVIGLALVGLTATFGESAKASVARDTGAGLRADYVVKADGFAGFSSVVAERLRTVPELDAVVPIRFADGAVDSTDSQSGGRYSDDVETVGGVDPAGLSKVVDLGMVSGTTDGLAEDGILLDDATARARNVTTGDTVSLRLTRGALTLGVRGVYRNENFIGIFGQSIPIIVSGGVVDVGAGTTQDTVVLVSAKPGEYQAARRSMERALGDDFPEHQRADPFGVPRRAARHRRPVPHRVGRVARLVGDHRHPRHHQHAGALGVRTHPRARAPAGRRYVASGDSAHGALGVGRHRRRRRRRGSGPRRALGLGLRPRPPGPGPQRVPDPRRGGVPLPRRVHRRGRHRRGAPRVARLAPRRPRSDCDRMTNDRISNTRSVWTRRVSALALAGFAITAGGCLGEPSASVAPNDLSSGHTVLLLGDSLMGGAATSLDEVLLHSRSGGISIVDAHLNGSGLVRPMDGMLPDDYVEAQFAARPDIDVVVMGWAGACEKPCPEYGTPEFYREWLDNATAVRAVVHAHGAELIDVRPPPPPPGSAPPESGYVFTDVVGNALVYFGGPTTGATPADWWSAFSGYDGAYYDTLFYEDAWHTVRVEDRIHFSADGRTRAAKVLAAAIQSALGMA